MNETIRRIGFVVLAVSTAILMVIPSCFAWEFSTQDDWPIDVDTGQQTRDAILTYYVYNCELNNADIFCMTGGEQPAYPQQIHIGTGHFVLHTRADLYLYWGEGTPSPPEECAYVRINADVVLYREVSANNWSFCDIASGSIYIEGPDFQFKQYYLSVYENREYEDGDLYRLDLRLAGYWLDLSQQQTNLTGLNTSRYYELIP